MTLVQGHSCPHWERLFVTSSDSSSSSKSEFFKEPARSFGSKSPTAATDIPRYFKDNLQQIFKTVLETQTPAPAPALTISKEPLDKLLKTHFQDIYCGKFQIDCDNFCQQCEDYFTTNRATGPNQILFAASFF